jgi:hypothetical protein
MKITTNNKPRELICYWDLPRSERQYFSYLDEDEQYEAHLFKYKGEYYDTGDHEGTFPHDHSWDGYYSQSFWFGVLFKWSKAARESYDYDEVIVGRYVAS